MLRFKTELFATTLLCGVMTAASVPAQTTTILAFGDSITQGFGDGNVQCQGSPGGYPPRLRTRLENRGLNNVIRTFGVCGELTSQGVSRLDQVLASNADGNVILLMEGTNDLSNNSISTESILFNLRTMAEKSLESGIRPVLASPIPRDPVEAGSNTRTAFLSAILEIDAAENDVDYAEQYGELVNINNLYERFYSDPFHPNSQGYDLVADNFIDATLSAASRPVEIEPCVASDQTLCLNEERFKVEVTWEDFEGNTGVGQAVKLTPDTGYFWFFDSVNVELVIKALDGQDFNGNYWIFYGALSTVEYTITVTDTMTGRRKLYFNPSENLASVGDTAAFPGDGAGSLVPGAESFLEAESLFAAAGLPGPSPLSGSARGPEASIAAPSGLVAASRRLVKMESCVEDEESLCLNDGRFRVRSRWTDFSGNSGTGKAVSLTGETGYFWFFSDANVEVVVKVLDGLTFNNAYWVFYGALSNVLFEIEVTDAETGEQVVYVNPSGNFGSRADTSAFPQAAP